jgi:hypothetical protein
MNCARELNERTIWGLVTAAALALGCSGADAGDPSVLENGTEQGGVEPGSDGDAEIGSVQQAWSVDSCGRETTAANATFTGKVDPATISPTTYNTCTKSYVVDINSLQSAYAGKPRSDVPALIQVSWAGAVPTTQAACEDTEGGAIFYRRSGSSWQALTGQVRSTGQWVSDFFGGFRCELPYASLANPTAGASYRVAATMRNISGGNPTRQVSIQTTRAVFIQ